MKQVVAIVVAVLAFVAILSFAFLSRSSAPWQPPSEGLIGSEHNTVYYIKTPARTVLIFLSGKWGSTSSSTHNPRTRAYACNAMLNSATDTKLAIEHDSDNADKIAIGGSQFNLTSGSVFTIDEKGKIDQLPFQPLEVDREYVEMMSAYLNR